MNMLNLPTNAIALLNDIDRLILPLHSIGLLTTFVCGGLVGLERQISGKPAGIRTSTLICMVTMCLLPPASP